MMASNDSWWFLESDSPWLTSPDWLPICCFKAEQIQKAEKRLSDAKASELEDNDAVVAAK